MSAAKHRHQGHWRDELQVWQRFPLRLLAMYGGAALMLIAALSMWAYTQQMTAEMDNLQKRLLALSTALAVMVDGDRVHDVGDGEAREYWDGVAQRFQQVALADSDVYEVYVLRTTAERGTLEHLVDVIADPDAVPGQWLEPYDATPLPKMMAGLEHPSVEEQLWEDDFGLSISGYAPIHDASGASVGLVGVDVLASRVATMQRTALLSTLAAFGIALLLLGGISMVIGRQIVHPLGRVIDASDAIAGGDLEVRIQPERVDEFGLLGRYFDAMADGLQEREFIRDTFGRYVSPRVANAILDQHQVELGGELREVTVLFSDLRGYSTLTEHAEPSEVVKLLNEYFGAMNEIIDDHDGDVIEFLGDGILAVFGAPVAVDEHPRRAVEAALAMRSHLERMNDRWEETGRAALWQDHGIDRLVMRIGIHTGRVVAGNMGSAKRVKYAVIGDNVNVAARLEQLNKKLDSTIAVSGATMERVDGAFDAEARGDVKVKGREDPVPVFTL